MGKLVPINKDAKSVGGLTFTGSGFSRTGYSLLDTTTVGTVLGTIAAPFGPGTTYVDAGGDAVIGFNPATGVFTRAGGTIVSGDKKVRKVRAISADSKKEVADTFQFSVGAGAGNPSPPSPSRELFATSNNRVGTGTYTFAGTVTRCIMRIPISFGKDSDLTGPIFNFAHWGILANSTYINKLSGSYTVVGVALEHAGQSKQAFFTGSSPSQVVDSTKARFSTLPMSPSLFGLTTFPKGGTAFLRLIIDAAAGQAVTQGAITGNSSYLGMDNQPGGASIVYDPANHIDQLLTTGGMTVPTGGNGGSTYNFALGYIGCTDYLATQNVPSAMSFGDSIVFNGMGATMLGWSNAANLKTAGVSIGVTSLAITTHVIPSGADYVRSLMGLVNTVIDELDTNDMGSQTVSDMYNAHVTLWGWIRAAGVKKILRTKTFTRTYFGVPITAATYAGTTITATIDSTAGLVNGGTYKVSTPYATAYTNNSAVITILNSTQFTYTVTTTPTSAFVIGSTGDSIISDTFRSKATLRPFPEWSAGGKRDQLDPMYAAALSSGLIDAIADTRSAVMDPTDDHVWKTNGSGGNLSGIGSWYTGDGLHPSGIAQLAAGVAANTALYALGNYV